MQVFKLWPRGDLNSADTFQLPSVQILKPKTESQGVPAAQGSVLALQLLQEKTAVSRSQARAGSDSDATTDPESQRFTLPVEWVKILLETTTKGDLRHFSLLKKK